MIPVEISDNLTILSYLLSLPRRYINTSSINPASLDDVLRDISKLTCNNMILYKRERLISDAINYHHFLLHIEICCGLPAEPSSIDWMTFGTIAFG